MNCGAKRNDKRNPRAGASGQWPSSISPFTLGSAVNSRIPSQPWPSTLLKLIAPARKDAYAQKHMNLRLPTFLIRTATFQDGY